MNDTGTSATAIDTTTVAACCTTLYSHPLAAWILGESMHPGGLVVTDRLADLAGIGIDSRLLDAGCGHGASALHLAAGRGCAVTGVTLEPESVMAATRRAEIQGLEEAVEFRQGDIESLELRHGEFDTALMECVLSTLGRREEVLAGICSALASGGRIAISDVTVSGPLPADLSGTVASALCIGSALSLQEYVRLVESAGFDVTWSEEVRDVAIEFIDRIRGALLMAEAAIGLGKLNADPASIEEVRNVLKLARPYVEDGVLSYGLVVGTKR